MKLVTAAQMQALERAAVDAGVSLDDLMEHAGLAVAEAVRDRLPDADGRRVVVLIGPGNNGGDGLVAARRLAEWGFDVAGCLLMGRPDPDVKMAPALDAGVKMHDASPEQLHEMCTGADVVLDAVLGTGRGRPIEPPLADLLDAVGRSAESGEATVVAIDLPTGVDSDTGETDPHGLPADLILTLGRPKLGLYMRPTVDTLRAVHLLPIGLPEGVESDSRVDLLTPDFVPPLLPERPVASNKGTFGRALIVGGSRSYVGAAYLAAAAAARSGAGLVALATPESVYRLVAPQLPDSIYLPLAETEAGEVDATAAAVSIRTALGGNDAVLIGPGIGQAPATQILLQELLLSGDTIPPAVLDADCLNFLAAVDGWWEQVDGPAVVTPHPGEMGRLTGRSAAQVQADRLGVTLEAAARWSLVVVLKGACTVIAHPDGRARIAPFANSGLATAGTGDVLAGAITGLVAQGLDPYDAASLGVYLHGMAGEIARDDLGEAGMLASDVLDRLPDATQELALLPF